MNDTRTALAARNNADWCDAVCRAHGRPGRFLEDIWVNQSDVPRFYPNASTLTGESGAGKQTESIRELAEARPLSSCGVKDSYCTLDLSSMGFDVLFEARWIYAAPTSVKLNVADKEIKWRRIRTGEELAGWARAWNGEAGDWKEEERIFLPALLEDETIAFVAGYMGPQIVAGAIGNRTGEAAGISNLFVPSGDDGALRAGCLAAVMELFPGLALVGYKQGEELAAMKLLGFEEIGPLRVWVKG